MNQRILITRPRSQAVPLIQTLKAQGDEPISLPLLEIALFDETTSENKVQRVRDAVLSIDKDTYIFFISTNAVDGCCYWLNRLSLKTSTLNHCFAIGKATQKRLKEQGLQAQAHGLAMNSESLLQLDALQNLQGRKAVIARGEGGRDFLRKALEQRGATVNYLNLYERKGLEYPVGTLLKILDNTIDYIVLNSGETIQQLIHQAMIDNSVDKVLSTAIIVPGDRLYQVAKDKGFKKVFRSQNAGVDAIVQVINN